MRTQEQLAQVFRVLTLSGWTDDHGLAWFFGCDRDEQDEVIATLVHALVWAD